MERNGERESGKSVLGAQHDDDDDSIILWWLIIPLWFHFIMIPIYYSVLLFQCLIPGRAIPKTQKMKLDASMLNTQHYK